MKKVTFKKDVISLFISFRKDLACTTVRNVVEPNQKNKRFTNVGNGEPSAIMPLNPIKNIH